MLTNGEKTRIKAEEIYREEVRKQLQSGKKEGSKFWAFLNSGFTLFFLSSIVIALISWAYTSWEEEKVEEELKIKTDIENERIRQRLSEETIARIDAYAELKDTIPEFKRTNAMLAIHGSSIYEDKSIQFKYYHRRPLYKDYEQWTMVELLAELAKYADKESRKKIESIKNALLNIKGEDVTGQLTYLKARNGDKFEKGILVPPVERNYRRWIFVTNTNDVFQLGERSQSPMPKGKHIEKIITTKVGWKLKFENGEIVDVPDECIPMVPYYTITSELKQLTRSMLDLKSQLKKVK